MSLKLLWHVFLIEAKKLMSYRTDFWVSVIGGIVSGMIVPYFLWSAIFAQQEEGATVAGFSLGQMVTYYVSASLLAKIVRGSDLPMGISQDIYEGSLNRYLLYPTAYLPVKYAQQLGTMTPALLQLFAFGAAFLLVFDLPPEVEISVLTVAMAMVSVLVAHLLYFLMAYPLQLVAFWADNVWSLVVLLRFLTSLLGGALLPLALFPEAWQGAIRYTPFPSLFSVPIRTLQGQVGVGEWLAHLAIAGLWCGAIWAVSTPIWRRGNLRYTGVGI